MTAQWNENYRPLSLMRYSWQMEGGKVEAVSDFIILGSKITVNGDYSHEIKRIAPWKESYDKPDRV